MTDNIGRLVIVILFFIAMQYQPVLASDVDDSITRIQKAYEEISDMKGTFVQKNVIKDLKKTLSYPGEFFIKRPLKMKWIYKGKNSQDLLITDDTVILYSKTDNQAYRSKFSKENYGRSPVVLLTGMGNIRDEFNVTGKDNTLFLKPKKPMAGVTGITLHLADSEFPIRAFTIQDGKSNTVDIELKDVRINTGLKDSLFDLKLPKGTNIYDQP